MEAYALPSPRAYFAAFRNASRTSASSVAPAPNSSSAAATAALASAGRKPRLSSADTASAPAPAEAATPPPKQDKPGGQSASRLSPASSQALAARIDWLSLVGIGTAYAQAQPDITIKTPAVQAIQSRMASRFDSQLKAHFESGALGIANDGTISVRDAGKIALPDRVGVNQAVAEQNQRLRAEGREEIPLKGLLEIAEQLQPAIRVAEWLDRADAAVQADRAGPGHVVAAGQHAGGHAVKDAEREH